MDACNFPELLALDLETAESIFTAKRMTAGVPRPMDIIFESDVFQDMAMRSHHRRAAYLSLDEFGCSKSDTQGSPIMATINTEEGRDQGHTKLASMSVSLSNEDKLDRQLPVVAATVHNGTEGAAVISHVENSSPFVPGCSSAALSNISGLDTHSVDSFEAPDISSSAPHRPHCQQKQVQQQLFGKKDYFALPRRASHSDHLDCDKSNRVGNSRNSSGSRDSYDSCYTDDNDIISDSASVSSFGLSVPMVTRGRQQSVATAATSVTSSGCRVSSQSHTLSAMGPSQRESLASYDRYVEFNLDNDVFSDQVNKEESTVCTTATKNIKTSINTRDADTHVAKPWDSSRHSCVLSSSPEAHSLGAGLRDVLLGSETKKQQSSWINFDDDYSGGMEPAEISPPNKENMAMENTANDHTPPLSHLSLPQRPKTALGLSRKNRSEDKDLYDWASRIALPQNPTTFVTSVSQSPSHASLSYRAAPKRLDQESSIYSPSQQDQQQLHRLRHFLSFSGISVSLDAFQGAPVSKPPELNSSRFCNDLQASDEPSSPEPSALVKDGNPAEEPPLLLQRTVYRKPIKEPTPSDDSAPSSTHGIPLSAPRSPSKPANTNMLSRMHLLRDSRMPNGTSRYATHLALCADEALRSQFDDDDDDENEANDAAKNSTDGNWSDGHNNNTKCVSEVNLFGDFEGTYDYNENEDQIMTATRTPFSRQLPRSLRSRRSLLSLETAPNVVADCCPATLSISEGEPNGSVALDKLDEPSSNLESWIRYASRNRQGITQLQSKTVSPDAYIAKQHDYADPPQAYQQFHKDENKVEVNQLRDYDAGMSQQNDNSRPQGSAQHSQPFPYSDFYQPGVVGIPLPREIVETLRVSVSCFPETMLSLTSFSIQTIRSYSRKIRRYRPSADEAKGRLLIASSPPNGLTTSLATPTAFASSGLPTSPTATLFSGASFDFDAATTRTMTNLSFSAHSARRFWTLPKRLIPSRTSPNLNGLTGVGLSSNANSFPSVCPPTPRQSNSRGGYADDLLTLSGEEHGKGSGICFKRIFPTGSDYLCDALYAHILAFNYISLLCPPPIAAPQLDSTTSPCTKPCAPSTTGSTLTTSTSEATLIETAKKQKRQTIRVYVGSDVALPPLSHSVSSDSISPSWLRPLSPTKLENDSFLLHSPMSTPPPSRERKDDNNRLISRKAAALLGISETLEPDGNKVTGLPHHDSSGGSASVRRYNSLRRRRLRAGGTSLYEAAIADSEMTKMAKAKSLVTSRIKKAHANANSRPTLEISKPVLAPDMVRAEMPMTTTVSTPTDPSSLHAPAPSPLTVPSSDAQMRDLQAGLHHCVSQLVSTLKLTTSEAGTTLLNVEDARGIDPLFMRMLCELVRSQEEQI